LIDGRVVADAVVHPYNLAPQNQASAARAQLDAVYAAHAVATVPEHEQFRLAPEEFFTDFPFEAMARSLFVESPIDLAVIHALPNLGFANGYVTDPWRAAAFRDLHPGRFLLYGTVDTPLADTAVAQLERQVEELAIDGLKVYPSFFYDGIGEGWRLDGDDYATPLLEAARDLGIRNVAIHKALWLPPAPRDAFRVEDLETPLGRFPELNFHIVHAGMAFVEETCALLRDHPNLHATLESTFMYANVHPERFIGVLERLLDAAGSERLMFGSGSNLMHPRPLLDAFAGFDLDERDRANILGANTLRVHELDEGEVLERVAGDDYATATPAGPWSGVRAGSA
jgi:predicted TIM-barrel fold metal-dependent hydrolase